MMKRSGPSTLPRGTPDVTTASLEKKTVNFNNLLSTDEI